MVDNSQGQNIVLCDSGARLRDYEKKYTLIGRARAAGINAMPTHVGGQDRIQQLPQSVKDATIHFIQSDGCTMLGYLSELAEQHRISLEEEVEKYSPANGYLINLPSVYREMADSRGKSYEEFLESFSQYKFTQANYRKRESSEEATAIAAGFFRALGLPSSLKNTIRGSNGFKNLYYNVARTLFYSEDENGEFVNTGGSILIPKGHYHSLVLAPAMNGGRNAIADEITPETVRQALERREELNLKAIYFSVVSNPDGKVADEAELREIAKVILEYNKSHPDDPVLIIDDQVYHGTVLAKDKKVVPISSISIPDLGNMFDYSIAIGSVSKGYGMPANRFGFATSGNHMFLEGLSKNLERMSVDEVSAVAERQAVAGLALVESQWFEANKSFYAEEIEKAKQAIENINASFEKEIVSCNSPEGGWHIKIGFNKEHLKGIKSSEDMAVFLMHYDAGNKDSGIYTLPGMLFGYEHDNREDDKVYVRVCLSMTEAENRETFIRLQNSIEKLERLNHKEVTQLVCQAKGEQNKALGC